MLFLYNEYLINICICLLNKVNVLKLILEYVVLFCILNFEFF